MSDRIRTHFPDGDPTNLGVEFMTTHGNWIPVFILEKTAAGQTPSYFPPHELPDERQKADAQRTLEDYRLHAARMELDKDLAFVAIEKSRDYFADKSEAIEEYYQRALQFPGAICCVVPDCDSEMVTRRTVSVNGIRLTHAPVCQMHADAADEDEAARPQQSLGTCLAAGCENEVYKAVDAIWEGQPALVRLCPACANSLKGVDLK